MHRRNRDKYKINGNDIDFWKVEKKSFDELKRKTNNRKRNKVYVTYLFSFLEFPQNAIEG